MGRTSRAGHGCVQQTLIYKMGHQWPVGFGMLTPSLETFLGQSRISLNPLKKMLSGASSVCFTTVTSELRAGHLRLWPSAIPVKPFPLKRNKGAAPLLFGEAVLFLQWWHWSNNPIRFDCSHIFAYMIKNLYVRMRKWKNYLTRRFKGLMHLASCPFSYAFSFSEKSN